MNFVQFVEIVEAVKFFDVKVVARRYIFARVFVVMELLHAGAIQGVYIFDAEVFWVPVVIFVAAGVFVVAVLVFATSQIIYIIPAVSDAAVEKFCSKLLLIFNNVHFPSLAYY